MVPRRDPVGATTTMVMNGLNSRVSADWRGILDRDDTLRLGLRFALLGICKEYG